MKIWSLKYRDKDGLEAELVVEEASKSTPLKDIDWSVCDWEISDLHNLSPNNLQFYKLITTSYIFALDIRQILEKIELINQEDHW